MASFPFNFQKIVRAGAWMFALQIANRTFQIARLIILARILVPADFGLMGIALVTMATLEAFSKSGFQDALIQKKENVEPYLNNAWTVLVLRGIILFAILFFTAPYAAAFFEAPKALPVIRVIGFAVLFQSLTNIGVIYFRKDLEFNKQFIYQFSGTLADFVVGVSAALILKSVWALVFGLLAGNIVRCIVSYLVIPYRPHFSLDLQKAKELFGFGKWILGSSVLVFLITQGDDIFVGKLLGAVSLGFYQMAYRISNMPATEITHVISQVAFPAYSKLQHDLPTLREAYLKILQLTAFLSSLITGLIFALTPVFITIFLGEKWMPIATAMQLLVLAGLIRSIAATTGSIFRAVGKPQIETRWQIVRFLVLAVSIYPLSIRWGISGVSVAVGLSILASTIGFSFMAIKIIQCTIKEFSKLVALPLINGAIMASLVFALRDINIIGIGKFLLLISAGILVYLTVTCLCDKFFNYRMQILIKESLIRLRFAN